MTNAGWRRWLPLSGLVSAVLIMIAIFFFADDSGETDQEIVSYYADSGNRNQVEVGFSLIAAGALLLALFVMLLRGRLRAAEGEPATFTAAAYAGGITSAALLLVANAFFAAPAFSAGEDRFRLDPNTFRLGENVGYAIFVSANWLAIFLVLGTSILAIKTAVLPRWLGWLGIQVAFFLLVAFIFVPFIVLLGWIALVSVVMTWWPERAGAPGMAAAPPR
jgi:hypothetical protein